MPHTEDPNDSQREIKSLQSSPDRTVFTEAGNPDGWIATDLTVQPQQ